MNRAPKILISLLVLVSIVQLGQAQDLKLFTRIDTKPSEIKQKHCLQLMKNIEQWFSSVPNGQLLVSQIFQVQKKFEKEEKSILKEYNGEIEGFLENLISQRSKTFSKLTEEINKTGAELKEDMDTAFNNAYYSMLNLCKNDTPRLNIVWKHLFTTQMMFQKLPEVPKQFTSRLEWNEAKNATPKKEPTTKSRRHHNHSHNNGETKQRKPKIFF